MSTLQRVLAEARTGATVAVIGARLGIEPGLAQVMVDELRRARVIAAAEPPRGGAGCRTCPPEPSRPLSCAGCLVAQIPRATPPGSHSTPAVRSIG